MNKKRTAEEIQRSQYIRLSELKDIYGETNAKRIYSRAEQLDIEEFNGNRVITNMVRLSSVQTVLKTRKMAV